MGNCGVGAAPCKKEDRDWMVALLEGVEDIPAEAIVDGIWGASSASPPGTADLWESFPEYLDALSGLNLAMDVGALVPHGLIRTYVLGQEAGYLADKPHGPTNNPMSREAKQQVADCVREAVSAGAVGFSTNRFLGHRSTTGELVPGTLADAEELCFMCQAMADAGGGVVEFAADFSGYDDLPPSEMDPDKAAEFGDREWDWMYYVAKEFGVTVNLSAGPGPRLVELSAKMAAAKAEGANVMSQCNVRPQALILSWQSKVHPFVQCDAFRAVKKSGIPKELWHEEFAQPEVRAAMLEQAEQMAAGEGGRFGELVRSMFSGTLWDRYVRARTCPRPNGSSRSIAFVDRSDPGRFRL